MASIKDTLHTTTGWLRDIFDFGFAFVLLLILIDILFATNFIVENLGEILTRFSEAGVVGLIALLFFLWIYKK